VKQNTLLQALRENGVRSQADTRRRRACAV